MNDKKEAMCSMLCARYVWYEDVMCCVQYDIYSDACYSHGMTFLTQFGKFTKFPNINLASLLTWHPKIKNLSVVYLFNVRWLMMNDYEMLRMFSKYV